VSPTRQRKTRAARIFLALAVAAVAAVAAFVVAPRMHDESASSTSAGTGAPTPAGGAYATGEAVAATSSAPYTIKPEPARVATDAPVKRRSGQVDVLLTYAGFDQATGTVQAAGFVAGVLEDGGTCTLTLTKGGQEVTATSPASADATTTMCGLLETPPGLAAGTWDAVLTYASAAADGESRSTEVSVP
jgi:hypothetical protein